MKTVTNRFGTGTLYEGNDLILERGRVYFDCAACMSVYSDILSFLKAWPNGKICVTDEVTFVILGCQVTDLAILNDIWTAERYHEQYPKAKIYMGGCLAQRFDIELPEWLLRLDVCRIENQQLNKHFETNIQYRIHWQKPFWVKDDESEMNEFEGRGTLFRGRYPLKIGAGCHGRCKYCTIRDTRGRTYEIDAFLQVDEFLRYDHIVLISDSPSPRQIRDWCTLAARYRKPISIRNVEPQVVMQCSRDLDRISECGLLEILHCPIQSNDPMIIRAMGRDEEATVEFIKFAQQLRKNGTKVATNIIIDYEVDGQVYHNMDENWLNANFDYWVWNPYFDGNWNREKAEQRFKKYISGE